MTTYNTGTVTVTNGSATVTGASTAWVNQVIEGDLFLLDPSAPVVYTVVAVVSATELTLDRTYEGATASAQAYAIWKISATRQSSSHLAVQVQALIDAYKGVLSLSGDDKTLTLDKALAGAVAQMLLRTGGEERFRLGLLGNDDLTLQRSANGVAFADLLTISRATGAVDLAAALSVSGKLTGADDADIAGGLAVGGNAEVFGELAVTGAVDLAAALSVSGKLTGADDADIAGGLAVGGNAEVFGELAVTGDVSGSSWNGGPFGGFRNKIINGDFTVNQRVGTRTPGVGVYGFDRWRGHASGLTQLIEGLPSGDYTLTFSSVSNGAGTIGGVTGQSPIYVTGLVGGNIWIVVPSDATRVSVVPGDARGESDPFCPRHPAQELDLCQRYFQKSYSASVTPGAVSEAGRAIYFPAPNGGVTYYHVSLKHRMRVAPSITTYSTFTGASGKLLTHLNGDVDASISATNEAGFTVSANAALNSGSAWVQFQWVADAEF